ncbi:ankyrin 2,3/unc44, partial [Metarhizium majus ARSEF 297]
MELSKAGSHHSLGEDVHLSACTPEKFNWILDRDACKNWIGPACRPLWLYEMAKSDVAASMGVLERKARAIFPDANIIKYSFDAHDDRCRSTYRMLTSLSHQLLTLQPGLFEHVRFLSLAMSEEVVLKIEHLWALLRSLLSCPPKNHGIVFCFVNMIDECDPSSNKFLNDLLLLADSGTSAGGFRLAITSHKAPDSDAKFAAHAINVIQERQEDPDEKKKEIESAIVRETRSLFEARPELKKFDSIINEKLRAVNDVFNISLLAKLLQEGLQELMPSEIETHLSALPLTTFEIYRCFMGYIPVHRRRWARDVLAWMIHVFRPLKVAELDLAMAIQDDPLSIEGMQRRLPEYVESDLKYVFGNLIQIQHDNVMFIDSSFRDFLIQDQPSSQEGNVMSDNHAKYARLCLRYLSLVTSQTEESKLLFDSDDVFTPPEGIEYGFLDYAVKYWFRHYNLAKHDDSPDLKVQACALLQTLRLSEPTWWKLQRERPVALFNPVHMAIRLGCNDIARTLLEKPECNAERFDHKDGIRLIKTRETAIDSLQEAGARHGVILYVAAMCGRDGVVDQILKDREQVEMGKVYTCPDGMTPLHQASSSGYHGVVRKLLNASYNANVWNKKRLTPLDLASQFGHVDVIEALLTGKEKVDDDENTDTNTHTACAAVVDKRPGLAQTSLMVAIEFQQPGAIERLLDRGAKLEENHMALCRAVASGREDIVRLILRYYEKLPANILHEAMATGDKDGCTPLHLAAREGYMNVVRQLIDKMISRMKTAETLVMKKSSSGDTPLHLAAEGGHAHVLKALIEGQWPQDWPYGHKCTIGVTNSLGQAPIHLAVLGGDASLVAQLCLEHHKQGVPLNLLDYRRQSPLHVACNHGLADMVDILLEHGAWSGDADENGDTPLLLGCAAGDLQMVKRLLTHDSSLLITNFKGRSALHHAAAAGEPDVVQELLRASSDANDIRIYVNAKDKSGSTPLHLATVAGNVQVIKTLLDEKADITQKDGSGRDVLYLASRHGHANLLAFLIRLSQKGIGRVDRETFPFGWDVFKTAQELLSNLPHNLPVPAEADMVTRIGSEEHWVEVLTHLVSLANQWTLSQYGIILHMAAKGGIVSVVDQVLLKGLDPNYADTEKKTALMHAAESGCSQVVKRLLRVPDIKTNMATLPFYTQLGAKVNAADESTSTPLHEAAKLGNAEMCKILLKAGAKVDFETKKGETPLILAIEKNHQEALKALLDAGADPLAETSSGTTPLHEAVHLQREAFRPVLSKVLSLNKSAHAKDVDGTSPLLLAAVEGTQEAFMDLVNIEGADINEKDENGDTPLCHAIRREQAAIVATLFKRPELQWRSLSMSLKDMFQHAAECKDDGIMKLLIQKGIDSGLPFDEFVELAMKTENLNLVEAALRFQDKPWLDEHGWSLECWKHALMKPEDKGKRATDISETDLVPPFGWCNNDEANAGRVHGKRGGFHRAPSMSLSTSTPSVGPP